MKVIEIDRLRFEVQSSTRAGESRFVDMAENRGYSKCDCFRWRKGIQPALDEYLKDRDPSLPPEVLERFTCLHVECVRNYLALKLVQAVREQYPDHTTEQTT